MTPAIRCIVAALLFGAATPAAKALLGGLTPALLAALLYAGAAVAMLPVALRDERPRTISRRNLARLAGIALMGGMIAPLLLMLGLRSASSGSVSLWLGLEPAATALVGWALFRDQLGARMTAAVAIVFAGGAILAATEPVAGWTAAALVAGACAFWGIDNNLTAVVDGVTAAQIVVVKGIAGLLFNGAIALSTVGGIPSLPDVGSALVVGALCYGVSLVLYVRGAQQLGATRSQILFASNPYFGLTLSWAVLGEAILVEQIVAAAVLLPAIWLTQTARHDHAHTHLAVVHTHAHRHDDGHHDHAHPELPAPAEHTHEHDHAPLEHNHTHVPDLHHRHSH